MDHCLLTFVVFRGDHRQNYEVDYERKQSKGAFDLFMP